MNLLAPVLCGASGLALGSFAVTAALRYGRNEGFALGRSRCDACGCALSFSQTVPILSYWGLRGACAGCGARIDAIHLIGELGGAAILASALAASSGDPLRWALLSALGLCLMASAAVDARSLRLPNALTLVIAACGAGLSLEHGTEALLTGLAYAACASVLLQALRWIAGRGGRDPGLGFGDVKLVAALGLWLGPLTPVMVAAAASIALLWALGLRRARGSIAFGPHIAIAAWAIGLTSEAFAWL